MVARFLLLLQYLLLFAVVPSIADNDDTPDYSTCYYPDLNVSEGYYSCNTNYYSMCCPVGAICLDTPLCLTADSDLLRGTCSDPNFADSSCPNFCVSGSFGNYTDDSAYVTACNSSNVPGALTGNHQYACQPDDCFTDNADLVPLGQYFSMTATWDAVQYAFTQLPSGLPLTWNGAVDAATGTDTVYGWIAAPTPEPSPSYSSSTNTYATASSTTSSTSMLSYSSESPTVYTRLPSQSPTTSTSTKPSSSEYDAFANASTDMPSPVSSTPAVSQQSKGDSHTALGKSAIIGIAVGCGLAVVATILAIFYCCRRRKNRTLHNTAGGHNNPHHYGMRRDSDVPETASMIAEADAAHEVPRELAGRTWVEVPEKGTRSEKGSASEEQSQPDSAVSGKESKPRRSHEQDEV